MLGDSGHEEQILDGVYSDVVVSSITGWIDQGTAFVESSGKKTLGTVINKTQFHCN